MAQKLYLWEFILGSVQPLSRVWLFATPWTAARQASLSITNCQSLLKLMSIESVIPSNHLILCHPLLLLPSIFPSTRVLSNESVLHIRWPKYWSFSFSISPSNEYSGLLSVKMDWLALLAVQGTLKSLLQHHSSKASILWHSVCFMVQLSHPLAFFLLAKDFIVWIFANMTLYTSLISYKTLHSILLSHYTPHFMPHFHQEVFPQITIGLIVCLLLLFSSVVPYFLWPHELWSARLLCQWDFPGKNTGVCCYQFYI